MFLADICSTQMLAAYLHEHLTEAGLDEAGRGCYAGPVFAAAVILPTSVLNKYPLKT